MFHVLVISLGHGDLHVNGVTESAAVAAEWRGKNLCNNSIQFHAPFESSLNTMGVEEFEAAQMFGAFIRDIIENPAASAADMLARGMADIFEKYAAEGERAFDKVEFLRIALDNGGMPEHKDSCASLDCCYDPRPCDCGAALAD